MQAHGPPPPEKIHICKSGDHFLRQSTYRRLQWWIESLLLCASARSRTWRSSPRSSGSCPEPPSTLPAIGSTSDINQNEFEIHFQLIMSITTMNLDKNNRYLHNTCSNNNRLFLLHARCSCKQPFPKFSGQKWHRSYLVIVTPSCLDAVQELVGLIVLCLHLSPCEHPELCNTISHYITSRHNGSVVMMKSTFPKYV